jgi:hypothetical protein
MLFHVLPELSTWHPFRDKLKGIKRDALEGHDIRVVQVFPHNSLLAKQLQSLSGNGGLAGSCVNVIPL